MWKPNSFPFYIKYLHVNGSSAWELYAPNRYLAIRYPTWSGEIGRLRTIKSAIEKDVIIASERYHELSGSWTILLHRIEFFRKTDGDIMAFLFLQEEIVKYVCI